MLLHPTRAWVAVCLRPSLTPQSSQRASPAHQPPPLPPPPFPTHTTLNPHPTPSPHPLPTLQVAESVRSRILRLYDRHLTGDGKKVSYAALRADPDWADFVAATAELQKASPELNIWNQGHTDFFGCEGHRGGGWEGWGWGAGGVGGPGKARGARNRGEQGLVRCDSRRHSRAPVLA